MAIIQKDTLRVIDWVLCSHVGGTYLGRLPGVGRSPAHTLYTSLSRRLQRHTSYTPYRTLQRTTQRYRAQHSSHAIKYSRLFPSNFTQHAFLCMK